MTKETVLNTETRKMTREEFETSLKNEQLPPEDVAAAFFTLEYPRFKAMLNDLSRNELVRLCLNLAGAEYVPAKNKLKTDKEKQAFYVGNEMVHNRAIMQLSYEMQKAEEAQQKLNEHNKLEALKEQQSSTTLEEITHPKQGE